MKLLVGLGNPGEKYLNTRHNVGFLFLDSVAKKAGKHEAFTLNKKCDGEVCDVHVDNSGGTQKIILLKPQTFMNDSGRAVKKCMDFYKIALEDVTIIHDDLDIAFGHFKIQLAKGPKVHNGITSVESSLQSSEFLRVRIGVENRTAPISGSEYVLQDFTQEEHSQLEVIFSQVLTSFNEF